MAQMTAEDMAAISPEYLELLKKLALAPASKQSFAQYGPMWGGFREGVQGLVDGVQRGQAMNLLRDETKRVAGAQSQFAADFQRQLAGGGGGMAGGAVPAMAQSPASAPPLAPVQLPAASPSSVPGTSVDTSGKMTVPAMAKPPSMVPSTPAARTGPASSVPGTALDYGGGSQPTASPMAQPQRPAPVAPAPAPKPQSPGMMRLGGPPQESAAPATASPMATGGGMFPKVQAAARQPGMVDRSGFSGQWSDPTTRRTLIGNVAAEVGDQFKANPDVARAKLETIANRAAARGMTLAQAATDRAYYPPVTLQRMQRVSPDVEAQYGPLIDEVAGGSNVSNYATGNASGTVGFAGGPQTYQAPGTYERFGIEGPDRRWADQQMRLGGPTQPTAEPVGDTSGAMPGIWNGANVVGGNAPSAERRGFAGQVLPQTQGYQPQIPQRTQPQATPNFGRMAPQQYDAAVANIIAQRWMPAETKQLYLQMLSRHAPLTEGDQMKIDTERLNQEKLRRELEAPTSDIKETKDGQLYVVDKRNPEGIKWISPPNATGESLEFRKARDKELGDARAKAQVALPQIVDTSSLALDTIEKIRTHPGRKWGTGWTASIAPQIPGSDARGFANLLEQAKGQTFLEAFNSLRGGGQITEAEGKKATQSLARLDAAQSQRDFDEALSDLKGIIERGQARARAAAAGGQGQAPGAAAQQQPQRQRYRFNPATGELE